MHHGPLSFGRFLFALAVVCGASAKGHAQQRQPGAGDSHVWADTYHADLSDVLQVQSGIAEQVVSRLRVVLRVPEP
jgi:hypothetical protein